MPQSPGRVAEEMRRELLANTSEAHHSGFLSPLRAQMDLFSVVPAINRWAIIGRPSGTTFLCYFFPAINRWAIFDRPLHGPFQSICSSKRLPRMADLRRRHLPLQLLRGRGFDRANNLRL